MRFSLFVHMERYDPATTHRALLSELVELVQIAEDGGFEAAWIGEHHGMEFTIAPNPFSFLAYLAARTTRIRLGTGTIIAPFWHPLRLAGEAAVVDLMSDGRLDLGIARGAYQFEFDRLMRGMPAAEGAAHLREMVPLLRQLWVGDVAHDGACWSFPAATSVPKPLQDGGPPIWVAAREAPSHAFAVEHGCNVQVTPLAKDDGEVEALVAKFEAAIAERPDRPRPKLMLLRHAFVVGSAAERRAAAEAIRLWYAYFTSWVVNRERAREGFLEPLTPAEMDERPGGTIEEHEANHVVGTPDEVIARLRRYQELGVDQFSIWIDNALPHAAKRDMLELWIREVCPAFA